MATRVYPVGTLGTASIVQDQASVGESYVSLAQYILETKLSAIRVVQSAIPPGSGSGSGVSTGGGAGSLARTFASSTTTGNLIVVVLGMHDNGQTITGVSDNKGNTYTEAFQVDNSSSRVAIFYCENATGGASHEVTATFSSSGVWGAIAIVEVSGCAVSSARDTGAQATDVNTLSAATSHTAVSNALAQDDEIVFAVTSVGNTTSFTMPGSGWSTLYEYDDWANSHISGAVYQVVTATDAKTATWTHASSSAVRASGITAFKAVSAAAATPYSYAYILG